MRFPLVTVLDNARAQHRLLHERFGVERLALHLRVCDQTVRAAVVVASSSRSAGNAFDHLERWARSNPPSEGRL